jgi:oligopeptidase B
MSTQLLLPTPPLAPQQPKHLELHGDVRIDPYFWLRECNNPAVLAYLQAENAYTDAVMRPTESLQTQLFVEMRGRLQETDCSVPDRIGDYLYYERTEAGQQYPIYCRKHRSMVAPEMILLDVNALADGSKFAAIVNYKVSPDQQLLAYALDVAGDETFTLYIKDLATGALLSEQIPNTYYGLEWSNDSRSLFYTVLDAAKRPYQIYRHDLGTDPTTDKLVFAEPDERFHLTVEKSKSDAYIFILCESNVSHEVWFLPADQPHAPLTVIQPRRRDVHYSVTHHADRFFITTNEDALNFRILTAPVDKLARDIDQQYLCKQLKPFSVIWWCMNGKTVCGMCASSA